MLEKDGCGLSKALRHLGAITVCVLQVVHGRCAAQSEWTAKQYMYSKWWHGLEPATVGVAEMLVMVQGCKEGSQFLRGQRRCRAAEILDGKWARW